MNRNVQGKYVVDADGDSDDVVKDAVVARTMLIVHYTLSFKQFCLVTVSCPLFALIVCFVTAYIFQADEIHEDHCKVYNIIPSISAITGVSPQRYLWRISVAFHIGPRLIIAAVSKSYHANFINENIDAKLRLEARRWLEIMFWLNVLEVCSLCGVTYVSNKENYPLHEKLFIVFMISSLSHMLACIKATKKVAETRKDFGNFHRGLLIKQGLFVISLLSTVGLVGFFLEHRFLCHDMAFSWFAFCEYIIASANMAFHITVILDFPTEHLVIARMNDAVQWSRNAGNSGVWKID